MKRRQFMTLAGMAAIGTPAFGSAAASSSHNRWQPDGVGSLARIGVLTPDFDPVPESEMWTMAPVGVSIHACRVPWKGEARTFAEPPYVDDATERLVGLKPRAIAFAFTSSSYENGATADDPLRSRLEKRGGGFPVVLTCPAAVEALRSLRVHRIALIHPPWFSEEISNKGMEYFRSQGFSVVHCTRIAPARPSEVEIAPAQVYAWVKKNVPRQAEALFIGGNGLRAIGTIQALEETLGIPVLTANQVCLWRALRLLGAGSKPTHYGRLFTSSR